MDCERFVKIVEALKAYDETDCRLYENGMIIADDSKLRGPYSILLDDIMTDVEYYDDIICEYLSGISKLFSNAYTLYNFLVMDGAPKYGKEEKHS